LYSELYSPKGAVVAKNTYRVENRLYEADDLVEARDGDRSAEVHRKRIEPWLSALFQSEHLNLLVGSGFSLGLASAAGAAACPWR
jgi:hypothetical protein